MERREMSGKNRNGFLGRVTTMLKKIVLGLMVVCGTIAAVFYCSGTGWANGTAAGTVINNGADAGTTGTADTDGDVVVTWSGGFTASTSCVPVSVYVSTGFAVTSLTSSATSQNLTPGSTAYYGYSVCNAGNNSDTLVFSTSVVSTNFGAGFPTRIYSDAGNNGVYESEPEITTTGALASDATFYFIVAVTIPGNAVNGSSTTLRLTVKDQNGAGTEDSWPVVGNDTVTNDTLTKYAAATLTVVKSSSVVGGAPYTGRAIPGGWVEYSIVVTNNGVEPASNVIVKDKVPTYTSFRTDAYASGQGIQIDTVAKTNAADADEADVTGGIITANLGTINPGTSKTITFQIVIQ